MERRGFGRLPLLFDEGIADLRARRYVWGAVGLVSAGVFLLTPIQTHAVKVDLPVAGR